MQNQSSEIFTEISYPLISITGIPSLSLPFTPLYSSCEFSIILIRIVRADSSIFKSGSGTLYDLLSF